LEHDDGDGDEMMVNDDDAMVGFFGQQKPIGSTDTNVQVKRRVGWEK
jgi:hypothetical protein